MSQEYESWAFGDSPEMADKLLALVFQGIKTGTCGALWDYEHHNEALPKKGTKEIILNGKGLPACLIELVNVEIIKFNKMNETFAASEGEGDLSLEYWIKEHRNFFTRDLPRFGMEFAEDMPLVCVNFKIVKTYDI
jgi:uncharacterized protein YhfF